MNKSKKSPTLFEIINRKGDAERGGFSAPSWFAGGSRAADEASPREAVISEPQVSSETDAAADSDLSIESMGGWRALLRPTNAVVAVGILAVVGMAVVQAVRLGGRGGETEAMLAADSPTIARPISFARRVHRFRASSTVSVPR